MRDQPEPRNTVLSLCRTIADFAVAGIRANRLAAALGAISLIGMSTLAYRAEYDERPRYRMVVLPAVERAERQYFQALQNMADAPTESWKISYFLLAHRKAREVLKAARDSRARTAKGQRAHLFLIAHYDAINEEFAIIRTEMSLREELDYEAEFRRRSAPHENLRREWLLWVNSGAAK